MTLTVMREEDLVLEPEVYYTAGSPTSEYYLRTTCEELARDMQWHINMQSPPLGWYHYEGPAVNVPDATPKSLLNALEGLGVDVRYNVRAYQTEWWHESFGGWVAENPRLTAKLKAVLEERATVREGQRLTYSAAAWESAASTPSCSTPRPTPSGCGSKPWSRGTGSHASATGC